MSGVAELEKALSDCLFAARLFAHTPHSFGGICLRGFGPVRDALVEKLLAVLEAYGPVHKIPINVDAGRLLGGIDLPATLQAGHSVRRPGILETATTGVVVLPMAERVEESVAAHLAQAIDRGELAVILLDDSIEKDEAPPSVLMERIALHCDLTGARSLDAVAHYDFRVGEAHGKTRSLIKRQRGSIAATAAALGVHSVRPLLFAERYAQAHARFSNRERVEDDDLQAAIEMVLAPRAEHLPQFDDPDRADETEPPEQESDGSGEHGNLDDIPPEDMLLAAAAAAIPQHILDQIDGKFRRTGKGSAGRSGRKQYSAKRGRPMGSRPGIPGGGKRLALMDSLRAAAPWQSIRRNASRDGNARRIHIRKSDLRVRHFEQRQESLTIFAVDASGSSALSRLAEAKGAVELMLAEAYVKRSQVALIAFRQSGAEILLPPTRSLTRARRALGALPGGGGTPLAAGLIAAQQLAEASMKRGQTPTIALLTDGKGNVMLDGMANRSLAMEEAKQVARGLAAMALNMIIIDISPRPRAEAAELAETLQGKYLPLPRAHSAALAEAIESVNAGQKR